MQTQFENLQFDEFGDESYDESLYTYDNVAIGVNSFEDITDDHVEYYKKNGFLVVQNGFAREDIRSWLDAIYYLIDGNEPSFTGVQYERSIGNTKLLSPTQMRDSVRKLMHYVNFEPRLKALSENNVLLKIVSRLIGATPELYVDQALMKAPGIGREKPWHQDHAFFTVPMGTPIIGCWVALDKATAENGCMHVKPGTHTEGPKLHFKRRDWQICDTHLDLSRDAMVPLNPGGVLFFDGLLHHGTPANRSATRRRSIQLHYVPENTPRTGEEERMANFGSEGKNITC